MRVGWDTGVGFRNLQSEYTATMAWRLHFRRMAKTDMTLSDVSSVGFPFPPEHAPGDRGDTLSPWCHPRITHLGRPCNPRPCAVSHRPMRHKGDR